MERRLSRLSLIFAGPGRIALQEEPLPRPAAGQLLIGSLVSGISCGTEILIYRGLAPPGLPVDETIPALAGNFSFPLKYGYAAVGRVLAVGPEASPGWIGKRVFSFHPHESHFLAAPGEVVPLPPDLSPEEAVFWPSMETAVNFLLDGRPAIGEQVAVFGQGVVGLLTAALLARCPLARLITLDRHARRRQASLSLGAGASLDPGAVGLPELLSLLGGSGPAAGADLVYELSGEPQTLEQALAVAGIEGRVVVGSWYGDQPAHLHLGGRFHRARLRLISSQVSRLAPRWSGRWTKLRRWQVAAEMLRRVRPAGLITHRFPIAQADQAYRLLDERPGEAMQVILVYPPAEKGAPCTESD
ncbi:MAG: zinc-binding alcohol dehydrogenase [Deltaproteobacteria bacterium]|nr:zinc-binding alcohol dehydrogenase [Deltaproteobacteria bacterium]